MILFKYYTALIVTLLLFSNCGNSNSKTSEIWVRGNCTMCEDRIEKAVKEMDGIVAADWNVDSKMLKIQFDSTKTSLIAIEEKVAAVGHKTKNIETSKEVNENLPMCCQEGFNH